MNTHLMSQGLEVALLGLAGVFATLIVFYAVTRVMMFIARKGKSGGPRND
jgi:Na+-transporting methylmalonyl-CoA/oxaloacetate decarboxylase gamma subunit